MGSIVSAAGTQESESLVGTVMQAGDCDGLLATRMLARVESREDLWLTTLGGRTVLSGRGGQF